MTVYGPAARCVSEWRTCFNYSTTGILAPWFFNRALGLFQTQESIVMKKHEMVRGIPAKAASIEGVLSIISVIVGLLGAIYTLIFKIVSGTV